MGAERESSWLGAPSASWRLLRALRSHGAELFRISLIQERLGVGGARWAWTGLASVQNQQGSIKSPLRLFKEGGGN